MKEGRNIQVSRILIADPHPVVREGIRRTLQDHPDLAVHGEAASVAELLGGLSDNVDAVLMEAVWADRDPLSLIEGIRQRCPSLPVLLFASRSDEAFALRCFRAGAAGFLSKDDSLDNLLQALRTVRKGKKYLTPSMAATLAAHVGGPPRPASHETLSRREYQVLRGIASGQSLTELGRSLCLSSKTVSTYRERVLRKLNLRTNAELVRYSIRHLES